MRCFNYFEVPVLLELLHLLVLFVLLEMLYLLEVIAEMVAL